MTHGGRVSCCGEFVFRSKGVASPGNMMATDISDVRRAVLSDMV